MRADDLVTFAVGGCLQPEFGSICLQPVGGPVDQPWAGAPFSGGSAFHIAPTGTGRWRDGVSSSDVSEGQVQGAVGGVLTLGFDAINWDEPQTVTIEGVDDQDLDGEQTYSIQLDPSSAGDVDYDALATVTVSATNLDDDVPAVSTMFIGDISLETTPRGKNKIDYRIAVLVIQENGATDLPLAGAQVTVTFAGKTYNGVTDADGVFLSDPIKGVNSGDCYANVVDLTFESFDWDQAFDLEDDSDDDSFPDELLTI